MEAARDIEVPWTPETPGAGERLRRLWRRVFPRPTLVHDEAYRLPLSQLEISGVEARTADYALWYLLETGVARRTQRARPLPATWAELSRVHGPEYLEALGRAETLARIFGVDPSDVPVDTVLRSVRLACGGTLLAARAALLSAGPAVNFFGGFHHAGPDKGGGFCALNDLAVALAALRAEGFLGQVVVLDLDAHPPDGTAACLVHDPNAWVGSLSGSDWGPLPGRVDETLLPPGTGDGPYLQALGALLGRMPRPAHLAFVIAGADVLAEDRLGQLALSMGGLRRRDLLVARALAGVPSVWLPGGGYSPSSWRAFAGTVLALSGHGQLPVRPSFDPLAARFRHVARTLGRAEAQEELVITAADLDPSLGHLTHEGPRLLGRYGAHDVENALGRYGLLGQIERLGYQHLRVEVEHTGTGDRMRLLGTAAGREHLLVDAVLERRRVAEQDVLFVNWLSLRHPRAHFSPLRPRLPGQEVPGLGLAREASEMLVRMAERLGLAGIAFRPAWYHLAYVGRRQFRFASPERQGRFEALAALLEPLPLVEASRLVAEGRVLLDGERYTWEPDDLVWGVQPLPEDAERVQAAREAAHFTLAP